MTSAEKNRSDLKKLTGYLMPVILTLLFLYLAFKNVDLKESFSLIAKASILWLILYVIVFYLSHLVRALRWKLMIKSVRKDISVFNLFSAVMIGYGVNCVIPRLGEIYRGLFIGRWEGLSRTTMLGTVVIERIIDIGAFAFASLLSVSIFPGNLFSEVIWLKTSLIIGFAAIFIVSLLIVFMVKYEQKFGPVIVKLLSKLSKKLASKFDELFSTLIDGLSSIQDVKTILLITIYTGLILVLYGLNSYVGFFMLDMQKYGSINFAMAWVFMTISAYGVIVPTPGGTGSYHIISIFVLTQLYSFNYELSAAYALLTHFISYVIFIGTTVGVIYIINKSRAKKGIKKENFFTVFDFNTDSK
ncbi:MAG: flippase-like domain-containing protein [Ignavibacteria bacterium]|nr:flippase-like domain-containing protein [Ignavibacteria bacterium]